MKLLRQSSPSVASGSPGEVVPEGEGCNGSVGFVDSVGDSVVVDFGAFLSLPSLPSFSLFPAPDVDNT